MTSKERDILDQLRNDVHQYHSEVKAHIATCTPYFESVGQHNVDLYGNPNDREGNPGLMSQVADLRKSRKIMLGVVAGAWTLATIFIGKLVADWL
jgi:hypothetical protein